jgi:hypothetical protein
MSRRNRSIDYARLAEALADELKERGLVVPARRPSEELVSVPDLAEEEGVTRVTIHRRITKWGLVRRDEDGYPKEGKGTTYVSRTAWEMEEPISTRIVRRDAGFHE